MLSLLKFVSRYRFVPNDKQLKELLAVASEKPEALKKTTIIVDGNLVTSRLSTTKKTAALAFLTSQHRKLDCAIVLVANAEMRLDKRIKLGIDHTTRLLSKEISRKEVPA